MKRRLGLETTIEGVCSVHPEQVSRTACDRCGDFVCASCYEVVPDGRALCASCRRIDDVASIPWERNDAGWPKRLVRTVVEVVLRPQRTLGRMRRGRLGRAFVFALLATVLMDVVLACAAVPGLVAMDLKTQGLTQISRTQGIFLGLLAILCPITGSMMLVGCVFTLGLFFHLASRAFYGYGTLAESLHAVLYVTAVLPWAAALMPFMLLPHVRLAFEVVWYALLLLWPPWALWHIARRIHGLRGSWAVTAALLPFGVPAVSVVAYFFMTYGTGG